MAIIRMVNAASDIAKSQGGGCISPNSLDLGMKTGMFKARVRSGRRQAMGSREESYRKCLGLFSSPCAISLSGCSTVLYGGNE